MNLNISAIKKIKPIDKHQIREMFEDHPGLGVTIGVRKITFFYRFKSPITKRTRTISLITCAHDGIPPLEMIKMRYHQLMAQVFTGIDPLEVKNTTKSKKKKKDKKKAKKAKLKAVTLDSVWIEYKKSPDTFLVLARSTQGSYQRIYEMHIKPKLGDTPITEMKRTHVVMLLRSVKPGLFNLCLTIFKQIEQQAFDLGHIEDVFIHHIKRKKAKPLKYFMEDETMARFLRFMSSTEGDYWPSYKSILLLQLLTGCRIGELLQLQWSEISDTLITIPASRIKTERKMDGADTPLTIPIVPRIQEVLDNQKDIHPKWVFPQIKRGSHVTNSSLFAFLHRNGFDFSSHIIRKTVASQAIKDPRISETDVKLLLNHSWSGMSATYIKSDPVERKAHVLLMWHEYLYRHIKDER